MSLHGRIWLAGVFPSTNEALGLVRAESVYRSKARHAPPASAGLSYSALAKAVRQRVAIEAWKGKLQPLPDGAALEAEFFLLRHERYDPDSWYLVGKWALDGLADAKVVRNDRHGVRRTGGTCFQTAEQSDHFARGRDVQSGRRGLLIELTEVSW